MTASPPKRRPASREDGRRERASELKAGELAVPRLRNAETITKFVEETLRARMANPVDSMSRQIRMVSRSSFEDRLAGVGAAGGGEELDDSV